MHTQHKARHEKTTWSTLCRCLGLLLFSLILSACSQGSDPQQGVISDDKLSAPFPKAITALLMDNNNLIVDVVVDGDTDNPLRVENLTVDTTAGTFSGNIPGFPTGDYTLSLVYSINDPIQGIIEVIRTSGITITVVANQDTPADFSSADMTYTDTDGDGISNLDELTAGTDINTPDYYTVGGQIEGLTGSGLVLQNNDGDDLPISANGTFSFSSTVADGRTYAVSVLTQPSSPNQICTVNIGSGTVNGAAISNIAVICSTTAYTVGGTVSGYTGSGLVLQNNDGDDLPISANGAFSFSSAIADGSGYAVRVQTHPGSPNQICTVNNGNGSVNGAAVSNITVICSTTAYTVGGTVSGYAGSGLVLQNNDGDDLPISANGDFTFATALADGSAYIVMVSAQPGSPNQVCTVGNDSGTVSSSTVIDVTITCVTVNYTIGGTVTGLIGGELVLQNNGGDDLVINADGDFSFATTLADGSAYAVTVRTPPAEPTQRCTIENGAGFLEGGDASVTVNCQLLLFISADDGVVGRELFATDGTATGTSLVKDINTNTNANPSDLVVVDGVTYFVVENGGNEELWKTNGTTGGTVMVKDAWPGPPPNTELSGLTAVGSTLYFRTLDRDKASIGIVSDPRLWKSDGTAAGTVLVKDTLPTSLTVVGDTLYFIDDTELWKTNGTAAGTVLVKDIEPGASDGFGPPFYFQLMAVGSTLYFRAYDATNGTELWKSDGTSAGTVMVKDIWPGASSAVPSDLTAVGDTLYFSADDGTNGNELWKSDGTAAGTVLVKNIRPGSSGASLARFTAVGSTLYFNADDGTNGRELWKSDGTSVGTMLVKDIRPGASGAFPSGLTAVGSTLYFSALDDTNGWELWKSDGTTSGTMLVKDIQPGASSGSPVELTAAGSTFYFSADNGTNGQELWKSDGTDIGTVLVDDINPGSGNSFPGGFSVLGGVVYFAAYDGINGRELWRSDGTTDGTYLLADIGKVGGDSNPGQVTTIDGTSYFTANDGANENNALWRSDGTAAGTVLVKNINITSNSLVAIGNTLYFSTDDNASGQELWKSNGTTAGTVLVKDIWPGLSSASPSSLIVVDNTLYFIADDGVTGKELWKSNGTTAGTVQVKDINFGAGSSSASNLTVVDSTLYFSADDGTNATELWKSDGTEAGTVMVKDIRPGVSSAFLGDLTAVGSTLYFRADDNINGRELWKSDGTTAGTVLVKDIRPGVSGAFLSDLTAVGSTLYFRADDNINGQELWKSDGTAAGTVLVKDIRPGSSSFPISFTAVGNTLYFRADDGTNGEELWKSDGTAAGTVLVKDIRSGSSGAFLSALTAVGNTLYFNADDGANGKELWKSDGTDAGTEMVKDINPNFEAGSDPVPLNMN